MAESIKSSASSTLSSVASSLGISKKEPDTLDEIAAYCPKLSFQQRVAGFCACFTIGYLITFGSFTLFIELMEGDPVPFVFVYSMGNILALLSSMFLCGPKRQFKNMFHKKRRVTTLVYLITLLASVIFCFIPMDHTLLFLILVVLVIVQCMALTWYCLTYIPFARKWVKNCFKDLCGL